MPFVAPFCHLDEGEILYAMPANYAGVTLQCINFSSSLGNDHFIIGRL